MLDIPMSLRFLLAALAVYRLARVVALEEGPFGVFVSLREWAGAHDYGENGQPITALGRLVSCPMCAGVWLAFPAMLAMFKPGVFSTAVITWLAIAGLQTFLYKWSE